MNLKGAARPRTEYGLSKAATEAGCSQAHILAVLEIEAPRGPFDAQKRPTILFEPHVFYRNLSDTKRLAAIGGKLASKEWGKIPYGTYSEQYDKLARAILIDKTAALKACSWGSPQILGENYAMIGYPSVDAMVAAFMESEDEQILSMAKFIVAKGLGPKLAAGDWAAFARGYNGPGYAKNAYDTKLAAAYAKHAAAAPAKRSYTTQEILDVQTRLRALGYFEVGNPDGLMGPSTVAAIAAFREVNGLPPGNALDAAFLEKLLVGGLPKPVVPTRADAKEAEVAEKVPELRSSIAARFWAAIQAIFGGVATVTAGVSANLPTATGYLSSVQKFFEHVPVWIWFAIVTAIAAAIWYRASRAATTTTEAYQIGARR